MFRRGRQIMEVPGVPMNFRRVGVWLIGAFGSVSTAVILGALLLRRGLVEPMGMITSVEPFSRLGLVGMDALEFGGCDIRDGSLICSAQQTLRDIGSLDEAVLESVHDDLLHVELSITRGTARNCGEAIAGIGAAGPSINRSLREEIEAAMAHLVHFRSTNGLEEVVVVNLASTEPALRPHECHEDLESLERCLDANEEHVIRASTIYAYAAIKAGCPFINFTPSQGALFPSLVQLAEKMDVPVMGSDGKTGETLVKTALAPMFVCRNLEILSWEGFNLLGNMDGQVLANPDNRESKIQSKDGVLGKILGYTPHSGVHIHYMPSLSDQKTAWDFIHFKGFLGTKMSLQFVWQGYDSLLAAPLVLDLVRFADLAKRRGERGLMPHLATYFKNPLGAHEQRLYEQYRMLEDYARQAPADAAGQGELWK